MDPDRAAAELPAVEREVVLHRPGPAGRILPGGPVRVARRRHEERLVLGDDARERVVGRVPAAPVLVPLVHREAVDPAVGEDVGIGKAEAQAELGPQAAEDVGDDGRRVGDDQEEVTLRRAGELGDRPRALLAEELDDRPVDPVGRDREVDEPFAPRRFASSTSSSIWLRLAAPRPGAAIALTRPPAARVSSKTRKPEDGAPVRAAQHRGEVDELHAEPEVGLVGPEPLERLLVGEAREGHVLERPLRGDRAGDLDRHRLDEVHHRLLGDEAHLEVELGELRLAVAAEVLVAEAAGDLEVAVDARDHEELLELLGALRAGRRRCPAGGATGR